METLPENKGCQDSRITDGRTELLSDDAQQPVTVSIESLIYVIRDEQVMLDSDLAKLYGVEGT